MKRILLAASAVVVGVLALVFWPRDTATTSAARPSFEATAPQPEALDATPAPSAERTTAPAGALDPVPEPARASQRCEVELALVTSGDEALLAQRQVTLVVAELDAGWSDTISLAGTTDEHGLCRWTLERPLLLRSVGVAASETSPSGTKWVGNGAASPGAVQRFELEVSAGAALAGRVVDELGRPLPGVEVAAWSGRDYVPSRTPDRVVTTDAAGDFEVAHVGPSFVLAPRGEGRTASVGLRGELTPGARVEGDLEVVLVPARSVVGQVLGPRGEAVEATLQVRSHWTHSSRDATSIAGLSTFRCANADASTDAEGRFELGPLPQERCGVRLDSALFGYRDLQLPEEPGPWTIRIDERVVLRGSVLDASGAPVAGARVGVAGNGVGQRRTITDERGGFEVRGLPDLEAAYVHVGADGFAPWIQEGIRASIDEPHAPIVARLEPGLPLAGRVVDAARDPVFGAQVVLEGDRPFARDYSTDWPATIEHLVDRGDVRTGLDGTFAFADLYPGRFAVRAYPVGQRELFAEVQADAGATDVEVVLDAANYERVVLSGRVVDALDGTPVESFVLTPMVESPDGNGASGSNHPVRDPEGRFRLALSSSARLQLSVAAPGYFTWSEPMRERAEGQHEYDVRLVRVRTFDLRLTWPNGEGADAVVNFRDEQDEPVYVQAGAALGGGRSHAFTQDGVARGLGLPASVVRMTVQIPRKASQQVPPQEFTLDLRRDPGPVLEFVLAPLPEQPARRQPVDAFAMVLSAARDAELDLAALEQHVVNGGWKDMPESVQLLAVDADLEVLAADGRKLMTAEVRAAAEGRTLTWRELETGDETEIELPAEVGCVLGGTISGEATLLRIRAAGHDPLELAFDATRENGGLPHVLVLRR